MGIVRAQRPSWIAVLLFALTACLLWGAEARAATGRHKVPDLRRTPDSAYNARSRTAHVTLTMHVATTRNGEPVVTRRQIRRWVARANQALAPHGLGVSVRAAWTMPSGHSKITRWRDRRALARYAPRDGTIHVFVVDRLDLFKSARADRRVRGLHWRYRGLRRSLKRREYVIVTSDAPSTTLVHEVGHLFGLRHNRAATNLMCSCRSGPVQRFSRSQGSFMRHGARRFLGRQRARR